MRTRELVVAALVAGASWGPAAHAEVLRVAEGESIQAAIDRAAWGDTVLVAPGTYAGALRLRGGVTLRGEEGWGETLLEGEGGEPIVLCEGMGDRAIEGFTLTGGPEEGGALRALLLQEGQLSIRDCRFTENRGEGIVATIYGEGSGLTIADTIVDGNEGRGIALDAGYARVQLLGNRLHDNRRGGLWVSLAEWADLTAEGNEIADNRADDGAGIAGLVADGAVARLTGNRVIWNRARRCAAIHLVASAATVAAWNNLIYGNLASEEYGGVFLTAREETTIAFGNNTVTGNEAPLGAAVAVEAASASSPRVVNCILWGNQPADLEGTFASYSVLGIGPRGGTANVTRAPRFLAPEREDFRLAPYSAGIDAGSNAALPETIAVDAEGEPRVVGAAVDCGAFEMAPASQRLHRLAESVEARSQEKLISPPVASTLTMRANSAGHLLRRYRTNGAAWALYHLRQMSRLVSEEAGAGIALPAVPPLLGAIDSITRQVEASGG
jgi:nitrous oxidase accessory protein NosD